MIKEILYKWFGLEPLPCQTCEVLREQLHKSDRERSELLHRLITPPEPSPVPVEKEDLRSIQPAFIPWRVKQQMLEAEDRKKAELMRNKAQEIAELETELGVK